MCTPLAVVVIILSMVPAAQFTGWQWVSLLLAAPVAGWGAWPLHRAALAGLGHAAATMDTLVSLAVAASFGWSIYALLFGGAGMVGMRMPFAFTFTTASGQTLYLEAAAGVTTAVLGGRYLEARARDRSTSALTALAELGAKSAAVLRDGVERRVPVSELGRGTFSWSARGRRSPPTASSPREAPPSTRRSSPASPCPSRSVKGDPVTGATVNMSGRLVVRTTRVGADTLLGPDHPPGHARAGGQGKRAAAGRPDRRRFRARSSLATATLGFWLGAGLPAAAGLERRRRRSRGRLSVRARPGHTDRARGRGRPRR